MSPTAERVLHYAWAATKTIMVLAFVLAIIIGAGIPSAKRKATCEAQGGHFVAPPFGVDECWSADGRARLFPEGF